MLEPDRALEKSIAYPEDVLSTETLPPAEPTNKHLRTEKTSNSSRSHQHPSCPASHDDVAPRVFKSIVLTTLAPLMFNIVFPSVGRWLVLSATQVPETITVKKLESAFRTQYQYCGCIGINVAGGLMPIILALYQFHRAQPSAILLVTVIVGMISYFLVTVIPGRAIVTRHSKFWLIANVAALSAMAFVTLEANYEASVAFAGGVLGTTIGADLLHLKDVVRPEITTIPLNIGGAGLNDGIWQCGLYALIIAEWLPVATNWLSSHVGRVF